MSEKHCILSVGSTDTEGYRSVPRKHWQNGRHNRHLVDCPYPCHKIMFKFCWDNDNNNVMVYSLLFDGFVLDICQQTMAVYSCCFRFYSFSTKFGETVKWGYLLLPVRHTSQYYFLLTPMIVWLIDWLPNKFCHTENKLYMFYTRNLKHMSHSTVSFCAI